MFSTSFEQESGIDGPDGWTINNVILQNHYYQALMGGINSASEPSSTVGSKAPSLVQKFQNNAGIGTPNRFYYTLGAAGKTLIMVRGVFCDCYTYFTEAISQTMTLVAFRSTA